MTESITRRDALKMSAAAVGGGLVFEGLKLNWLVPNAAIVAHETDLGLDSDLWVLGDIHKRRLNKIARINDAELNKNPDYVRPVWQIKDAVEIYKVRTGKEAFYSFLPSRLTNGQARDVIESIDLTKKIRSKGLIELKEIYDQFKSGQLERVDLQIAKKIAEKSPEAGYSFYINSIILGNLDPLFTSSGGIQQRLKRDTGIEIKYSFDGVNINVNQLSQKEYEIATEYVKKILKHYHEKFFSGSHMNFIKILAHAIELNEGDVGLAIDEVGLIMKYMSRNDLETGEYIADKKERLPEIAERFKNFKDTFSIFGRNFRSLKRQNNNELDDAEKDFSWISNLGAIYHGIQSLGSLRQLPGLSIKPALIWEALMHGGLLGKEGDMAKHGSAKMYFNMRNGLDLDEAEKFFRSLEK